MCKVESEPKHEVAIIEEAYKFRKRMAFSVLGSLRTVPLHSTLAVNNLGSSSVQEPVKLTSDVKQKKNKEVNITDPNPYNSYKTKKKFTGSYTEVNP